MNAELTQADIYTPSEANAFHEGFTEATLARFNNEATETGTSRSGFTVGEATAFNEGLEVGSAHFNGVAYLKTASE